MAQNAADLDVVLDVAVPAAVGGDAVAAEAVELLKTT